MSVRRALAGAGCVLMLLSLACTRVPKDPEAAAASGSPSTSVSTPASDAASASAGDPSGDPAGMSAGASASAEVAAEPTPPASAESFPPVFEGDSWTHDPTLARAPDGSYLAYATHNLVEVRRTNDLKTFTYEGSALPADLTWSSEFGTTSDLWAPDVSFHDGLYWLYYSVSTFGSQNSAIGLATSPTGAAGSFTDKGLVYSSKQGDDYNAIDPNLIVDSSGKWWLAFGSFWTGIKMIRLDEKTGMPSTMDTTRYNLATRPEPPGAVEAPFIRETNGYFYLFVSFDLCCKQANSTYRIMVGRSRDITGPYVDKAGTPMVAGGGTELLKGSGDMHGPGGQSVLAVGGGDILAYHFYSENGTPTLGVRHLDYSSGWPELVE